TDNAERIEFPRPVRMLQCSVGFTARYQKQRALLVGVGIIRIKFECALEFRLGVRPVPSPVQLNVRQREVRAREARVESERSRGGVLRSAITVFALWRVGSVSQRSLRIR